MTSMPHNDRQFVIVEVDTNANDHVAMVIDQLGRLLGDAEFPTTRAGYRRMVEWASKFGVIDRIGIEGTGSLEW